jgi:hypothetical protein
VGFEPTIPVFERAKTVHASDCAATVIGEAVLRKPKKEFSEEKVKGKLQSPYRLLNKRLFDIIIRLLRQVFKLV